MRVINLQTNGEVLIMGEKDNRTFELTIPKEQFKNQFGVNFRNAVTFTYEPDRNMFIVEYPDREIFTYNSPNENKILREIASKENDILNFGFMKFIEAEAPKYHIYEDGAFKLMEGFEEEYENYKKKKKAMGILKNTALSILIAQEAGVPIPDDVQRIIDEAKSILTAEDYQREISLAAGLVQSPGSKQAVKAGVIQNDPFKKKRK